MSIRVRIGLSALLLATALSAIGQSGRFDISLEGPWIYYVEPKFDLGLGNGSSKAVLVAIAPNVVGHNRPIVSTGDGFLVDHLGVYCLGFDGACKPNDTSTLSFDKYADPSPISIEKPWGFNWAGLKSAYIFILPMPDSWSSDGKYSMSFQSAFPTALQDPPTTENAAHSIGIQLHYATGPRQFELLQCTGTPSVTSCATPYSSILDNTGTLRIHIKHPEHPGNPDSCDYHVHRAYHKMISLIDPALSSTNNANKRYVDVPKYSADCSPCDPQQDMVSSDCDTMGGGMSAFEPEIPKSLDGLLAFLNGLSLNDNQKQQLEIPQLTEQANKIRGKFPKLTELEHLSSILNGSEQAIDLLLEDAVARADVRPKATSSSLGTNLRFADEHMHELQESIALVMFSATSGKDCRVGQMLVQ